MSDSELKTLKDNLWHSAKMNLMLNNVRGDITETNSASDAGGSELEIRKKMIEASKIRRIGSCSSGRDR